MLTFKQVGKTNTDVTLKLAIQTALQREMDLVVATTKGDTALRAAELAREMGFTGKLVAVSCAYGAKAPNANSLSDEVRSIVNKQGRLYTERLFSAVMEAGFDLHAMPLVMLGGGACIVNRHVSPKDGLCRVIPLLDDRVNAIGFERALGRVQGAVSER